MNPKTYEKLPDQERGSPPLCHLDARAHRSSKIEPFLDLLLTAASKSDNGTLHQSHSFHLDWTTFLETRKGSGIHKCLLLCFSDKPIMIKNPIISRAAADIEDTAHLICEARGVPNVTFSWMRVGGAYLVPSNPRAPEKKFSMTESMIDPLTWRSELFIFNVSNNDYGAYECVARNTEGKFS